MGVGEKIVTELKTFKNGLTMTAGDCGSLSQLFFDNLSTLLGAVFAIYALKGTGVSDETLSTVIFGKIVPGVGVTLFMGNVYYSWQAIRLSNKHGRQYTAQPYGLNTPAAFAFVFNIIYNIYFQQIANPDVNPDDAFMMGYKVALAANFITGLILIVLGCFGQLILKVVPPAALLVPIAGLGISFLGLEQLSYSIAAPIVGYPCIMWVYLGWFAFVKVGYGPYRLPEAVTVILVGVILGWSTGLNKPSEVEAAAQLVKWWGPTWAATELFSDFSLVADYLGIVIPIGISAAATTLMCLVSAKEAGDPYPVRESMLVDGIGTALSSFFGSPFGTVIYIGHPMHKRNGAKVGYSLVNGCIYFVFSWIGILALIQSIVNAATIGPIVFMVCLMINEETLNFMPPRHYSAYIIGLFPMIYDWCVNVSYRSPQLALDGFYSSTYPVGSGGFIGVLAWKRGSLLVAMLWVAMLVMVLDRKWVTATIWALISALFAVVGIIHVPQAGFDEFSTPTYEQCWKANADDPPECWYYAEQWMFFVAYLILAAHFAVIEVARRFLKDESLEDVMDDPSAHAFDDWFAHAATPPEVFAASKHLAVSIRNGTATPEEIAAGSAAMPTKDKDVDVEGESSDEVDL